MLSLFLDNLLPVFLAAGCGYALAARLGVSPAPLSSVAFFVFAPCLVFQLTLESELSGAESLRVAGFTVATMLVPASLALGAARLAGWSRTRTAALVLVVLLPNAGNFGLSVNLFAFGEDGLAAATVFFVVSSVMTFTVGVFVASMGRRSLGATLRGMLRVPALWAVPLALLLRGGGWELPVPFTRTVHLLAQASIPVFLVVLGMQLQGSGVRGARMPIAWAAAARLVGGATAGLLLAKAFGLGSTSLSAGVVQSAMPSAIITTVLAAEYDVEPAFVTSVVVVTTLACPLVLTPLLGWVGS